MKFASTLPRLLFLGFACAQFSFKSTKLSPVQDSFIPSRVPQGISYFDCSTENPLATLDVFKVSRNWCFGTIHTNQFDALALSYGSWWGAEKVEFDAKRNYSLIDFLHPAMQATHRHEFTPIFAEFPAIDYRIGRKSDCAVQKSLLTTNCWGFAYSVLSSVQRKEPFVHVLSAGDAQVAYDVFTDDRVFSLIQSVENEQSALLKNQTYRNENLKQGDVVLFWHQNKAEQSVFLDHVAIFIDDDLYYERAGAGDHVPFRLNDWNSILKSWMPGVFNMEWRRVVGDLLPVESAFGMHSVNTLKQIPEAFKIPEKLADQFSIDLEIENGGITGQTYVRIFDFKVASNTIDISRPVYILPESLYSNQSYPLNLSDPFCKISVE